MVISGFICNNNKNNNNNKNKSLYRAYTDCPKRLTIHKLDKI